MRKNNLVYGLGINDADYPVLPRVNGWRLVCPFYRVWTHMLERCYNPKYHAKYPTYIGCSVVPDWHSFMAFRAWMSKQKWEGLHLDKDLLLQGNKVYGPDTCIFIAKQLNNFTVDCAASRGEWPTGVHLDRQSGKFKARCNNPFTGKRETLGYFTCPDAAHEAWRKRKHEHALALAAQQADSRLAKSLSIRYLPKTSIK